MADVSLNPLARSPGSPLCNSTTFPPADMVGFGFFVSHHCKRLKQGSHVVATAARRYAVFYFSPVGHHRDLVPEYKATCAMDSAAPTA